MDRLFKALLGLIFIGLLLYIIAFMGLIWVGRFLTPSDPLQKADVIVVLSGENDRTAWGIKLFQDGWAPRILFSGAALDKSGPSNAAAMRDQALAARVPADSILVEEKSTDTFENAAFSKQILDSVTAKKIILVTSPYHQRRAYESFQQVYNGDKVTIINSPSGYSQWSSQGWWRSSESVNVTISELLKILLAKVVGGYS